MEVTQFSQCICRQKFLCWRGVSALQAVAVSKPVLRLVGDTLERGKDGLTELEKACLPVRIVVVSAVGRAGS